MRPQLYRSYVYIFFKKNFIETTLNLGYKLVAAEKNKKVYYENSRQKPE
jgi:hypothetical protein